MTEEARLAKKYRRFGVTESRIKEMALSGVKEGFSYKVALTGVRMALGEAFNQPEYFTVEETAEALGVTVEEVNAKIKENEDELMKAGDIVKVKPAPGFESLFS